MIEHDWLEFDETEDCFYLTPELLLEYKQPYSDETYEALGLGDLEDKIVAALERVKLIPWGKLCVGYMVLFLVYCDLRYNRSRTQIKTHRMRWVFIL